MNNQLELEQLRNDLIELNEQGMVLLQKNKLQDKAIDWATTQVETIIKERDELRAKLAMISKALTIAQAVMKDNNAGLKVVDDALTAAEQDVTQWQAEIEAKAIEECIEILATFKVYVGNSCAGEYAAEWTMQNLREMRGELEELAQQKRGVK